MHGRHLNRFHGFRTRLPAALLCGLLTFCAQAASVTVNSNTADNTAGDQLCSLREALDNALSAWDWTNGDCTAGTGTDTIGFDPAAFPAASLTTISLNGSPLYFSFNTANITIDGDQRVMLDAGYTSRVLYAEGSSVQLTLRGLTLKGGATSPGEDGGGIYLDNGVTFRLENSVVSSNTAAVNGGGIFSRDSTLTVVDSLFTGNQAGGEGGAIYSTGSGSLTVDGSRFEANTGQAVGGALRSGVPTTITGTTITGNALLTPGSGAGVSFTLNRTRTLNNNTIINNAPGNNCGGESFTGSGNQYWPPSDTSCSAGTGTFVDPTPAPVPTPTPVPTLEQWALMLLSTLLAGLSMTRIRGARVD